MNYESIGIIGCGRVGLKAGLALNQRGLNVFGTTRSESKANALFEAGLEAVILDLGNPQEIQIPKADAYLITLTPRPKVELERLAQELEKLKPMQVVVSSSTSVYPDSNKEVVESDAASRVSPHSGLNLFELEEVFSPLDASVVRFGGLFGNEMKPGKFLRGKKAIPGGLNPVNMTHLTDAADAMLFCLEHGLKNERFNAVSPEHPTRMTFYSEAANIIGVEKPDFVENTTQFKIVSSQRIIDAGYTFNYQNPIDAL